MNKKEQSGFTLVEVVIASGIMALVLSGFIATFVMSQRSAILASNRMEACHIARENMDKVICNGYSNSAVSVGQHTIPAVTNDTCVFKSWYVISNNIPCGVKDIRLVVSWANPKGVSTATVVFCHSLSLGLHP